MQRLHSAVFNQVVFAFTFGAGAVAQAGQTPAQQAAMVQNIRTMVKQTDAARSKFKLFKGDAVRCMTDVGFSVEVWTDKRGVVRRLYFASAGYMGGSFSKEVLYRDPSGKPRYYSVSLTSGLRPMAKTGDPENEKYTSTELFIDPSGKVIKRVETGQIAPENRVAWPQVLKDFTPAKLIKEYTCQK